MGPPTGRSEQETLPIENTAAAEEIDRKPYPALWQGPRGQCQLLCSNNKAGRQAQA